MPTIITLKYPARCKQCDALLSAGARARWYGQGVVYGLDCHGGKAEGPLNPLLGGVEIVKAFKAVSRHGESDFCVEAKVWGKFPRGRKPHLLTTMWTEGGVYLSPLFAHVKDHGQRIPADEWRAFIRGLPIIPSRVMPLDTVIFEAVKARAAAVESEIEILPIAEVQSAA